MVRAIKGITPDVRLHIAQAVAEQRIGSAPRVVQHAPASVEAGLIVVARPTSEVDGRLHDQRTIATADARKEDIGVGRSGDLRRRLRLHEGQRQGEDQ